jgi:hypothetical protein
MKTHQWIFVLSYTNSVLLVKYADRIFRFFLFSEGNRKVDACIHIKPEIMSWYCQRVIIVSPWNTWEVGGWVKGVRTLNTIGAFIKRRNKWTLVAMVRHRSIYMIIMINIKGWAIWPVPSPELQLLSPTFLWSPNRSLSLWTVVVWFWRDSVLWHSLQV